MFKRIISILMILSMVFALGACGDKDTADTDTSDVISAEETISNESEVTSKVESKTESKAESKVNSTTSKKPTASKPVTNKVTDTVPAKLKGTTLKILSWNVKNDVPGADKLIKKFTAKTKIKVEWQTVGYDDYQSKIAAMVNAKNAPDIIRMRGVVPGTLSLMQPITASGYDFKESMWDKFISDTYTFGGKTYAVNLKNTLLQQPLVMFYNTELVAKYDISDPYTLWMRNKSNWNWDTFTDLCEDYKSAAGKDSMPWALNDYNDYAMTFGTAIIKRNGDKFVSNMKDGKLLTAYQKTASLIQNKLAQGGSWDINGFNTGKYLFFGPSIISARKAQFQLTDLKKKGALGVVPYPSVKGQKTYYQNIWEPEAYGIPKNAKNPEAVPYFLKYYLDADNYDANTFFNDKKILNVYNWCMNETTLVPEYSRHLMLYSSSVDDYEEFRNKKLPTATPDQIKNTLDTFAPIVTKAVNEANASIAKLK